MRRVTRYLLAASVAGVSLALAPQAGAQPSTPGAPGYLPGAPDTEPGSFSYPYNVIPVGPPPATDARGARISAGVDSDMKSAGLPGSSLGNSPQAAGPLVTSNSRYGISAGAEPPQAASTGIDARAGIAGELAGESPSGQPPQLLPPIESAQPAELTTPGGYPAPILETPGTIREGPAGAFVPAPQ